MWFFYLKESIWIILRNKSACHEIHMLKPLTFSIIVFGNYFERQLGLMRSVGCGPVTGLASFQEQTTAILSLLLSTSFAPSLSPAQTYSAKVKWASITWSSLSLKSFSFTLGFPAIKTVRNKFQSLKHMFCYDSPKNMISTFKIWFDTNWESYRNLL